MVVVSIWQVVQYRCRSFWISISSFTVGEIHEIFASRLGTTQSLGIKSNIGLFQIWRSPLNK